MPRYRITITGSTEDAMADLIRRHNIRVFDHGVQRVPGRHVVHAVADDQEIRQLEAYGYQVTRHEDVDEEGQSRQREVGEGNRYRDRDNTGQTEPR
jgi:hypothetical protein